MLGCKVDKIFLRAPLVFMEHRAPLAPMDTCGRHLWQLIVGPRPPGWEGGGVGGRGSWRPMTRGVAPPPPPRALYPSWACGHVGMWALLPHAKDFVQKVLWKKLPVHEQVQKRSGTDKCPIRGTTEGKHHATVDCSIFKAVLAVKSR